MEHLDAVAAVPTVIEKHTSCSLRWVKVGSKCIVRGTEVCKDIAVICGRFVTIYGDSMAAV